MSNYTWEDAQGVHIADVDEAAWNAAEADGFSDYDPATKPYRNTLIDKDGMAVRSKLDDLSTVSEDSVTFFKGGEEVGVVKAGTVFDEAHRLDVASDDIMLSAVLPDETGSYIGDGGMPVQTGYLSFDSGELRATTITNRAALAISDTDWAEAPKYRRAVVDSSQFVDGNAEEGVNDVLAHWGVNASYARKEVGESEASKHAGVSLDANELGTRVGVNADRVALDAKVSLTNGTLLWDNGSQNYHVQTAEVQGLDQGEFSMEKDGHLFSRTRNWNATSNQWDGWTDWMPIDTSNFIKIVVQDISVPTTQAGNNASGSAVPETHNKFTPVAVLDWWWKDGTLRNWFQNYGVHLESGNIYYRFLNNHPSGSAHGTLRVRMLYIRTGGFTTNGLGNQLMSNMSAMEEAEI